jgi:hypothetical protein
MGEGRITVPPRGGGAFRPGGKRIRLLYEWSTLAVGRGEILPPCASGCMS